jgi:hypothetical protein
MPERQGKNSSLQNLTAVPERQIERAGDTVVQSRKIGIDEYDM